MTPLAEVLGESPGIQALRATLARMLVAGARCQRVPPLLILGATGTGKGLLARVLHGAGSRSSGPLPAGQKELPEIPPPMVAPLRSRGGPRRPPDRAALLAAFEATRANVAQAAARLGIPRGTLRYQLEKLGLAARMPDSSEAILPDQSAEHGTSRHPGRPEAPLEETPRRLTFLELRAAL